MASESTKEYRVKAQNGEEVIILDIASAKQYIAVTEVLKLNGWTITEAHLIINKTLVLP